MPVTQIVEFPGSTGLASGAAVKLYAPGSDTASATASAVVESTNRKGVYQATFADVPAGNYLLSAIDASGNPICADPLNGLTLTNGTFQTASIANSAPVTLPATAPAGWITAAGIAASALNGKGDWLLASSAPTNFSTLGIGANGHISNVDTLTTYTGNTPQTGDSFARLGAPAGASIAADIAQVETHAAAADTQSLNTYNVVIADEYTDTSVNPWARVRIKQGTGGIGVGTELVRQKLYDVNGVALTSTTTIVGAAHV